jgi:histidine triad (HIT) family protein
LAGQDCIFCRIVAGAIPAAVVHREDGIVAFRDVDPQAPTHILVIPTRHVETLNALDSSDGALMGRLILAAKQIAEQEGIAESGYRLVLNTERGAGQSVFHLHLHVLGGRAMRWPPG